jgi:hypothetical protein
MPVRTQLCSSAWEYLRFLTGLPQYLRQPFVIICAAVAEIIQPSRDRTDHQVQCSKACGGRRIRGFSIRYH